MDFTQELLMFQGALTSADNVHKFARLTSKGGNEEKLNFVIQSVKRFLLMEKYIDENGLVDTMIPTTRKFAVYIILNADLKVLQDMVDIPGVEPIIWTIPTVPKYLMCEMIYQFHMEMFIYEVIPNCWPQLGLEVAEAFLENFKYFNPTECLDKLYKLTTACYALICRITYFKLEDDVVSKLLTAVFSTLQNFLKYYINPPNKYKLDLLNDTDLYKYKAKHLQSILFVVYDCCNLFIEKFNPNCDDTIYKLTHSEGYLNNSEHKVSESSNKVILEYLDNSNTFLLDVFKQIVMDITVDIFCAWSEYEENGISIQQTIGELCHKILTKLQSICSFTDHPVVAMIQVMARKPTEIKDIINSTDTETILQKIDANDEDSASWMHALVYKENLGQDLRLIKVIRYNTSVFDDQECFALYNAIGNTISTDCELNILLSALKINLINKCNVVDKFKILKDHFRDKIFTDTSTSPFGDYEGYLNEMFNKLIADTDADFTDVPTAFYQSPQRVYKRIFEIARDNTQLIGPMVKLMTLFKDFSEHYYSNNTEPYIIVHLKYLLQKFRYRTESRANMVKFICELKKQELISSSRLLMTVIMPSMHCALLGGDFLRMHIQVQLLIEAYSIEELLNYRAPMLVMMGQVMEAVRCREVGKFLPGALHTLEITIQFQKTIINSYQDEIPDTEVTWLQNKLTELNMHPMNKYYYRSLWNLDTGNYFESVTEQRIYKKANLSVLAGYLVQVMPWAILHEWAAVWDDFIEGGIREKHALRLFHSTINELTKYAESNRSLKSLACLCNCYRNLVHIIRYKFFKEPLTDSQVKTCMTLLSQNLSKANPQDANYIATIIGPLFGYLAERKNDYTVNIAEYFTNNNYLIVVNRYIRSDDNQG